MKTSVIRQRVADFLRRHAPFDSLEEQDLLDLAGSGKVKFHESDEYVYCQGDAKGAFVWTIQQGRVELLEQAGGKGATARRAGRRRCAGAGTVRRGWAVPVLGTDGIGRDSVWRGGGSYGGDGGALPGDAAFPGGAFFGERRAGLQQDELAGSGGAADGVLTGAAGAIDADGYARGFGCGGHVGGRCGRCYAHGRMRWWLRMGVVLTGRDLAMFCGHDAAGVVEGIREAASAAEIAPLLELAGRMVREGVAQPQDIDDCCAIGGEVLAALVEACLRLAGEEVEAAGIAAPKSAYCWMMFGGAARCDAPGWEAPALAAIYDDAHADFAEEDSVYFAALAGETAGRLHALGLPGTEVAWPEGARPSMPLSEWKRFFSETIRNPLGHDLYARRGFFDLRLLSGEAGMLEELERHVAAELAECEAAIPLLAIDTMGHVPPVAFFEGLVMEIDGAQRESFDIGEAVMAPLSNAARVLSLAQRRLTPVSTLERLEMAAADFPGGAQEMRQAADAFRIGVYYQALAGGSRIDCAMLGKFDQKLLKTALVSIERFLEYTVNLLVPVE